MKEAPRPVAIESPTGEASFLETAASILSTWFLPVTVLVAGLFVLATGWYRYRRISSSLSNWSWPTWNQQTIAAVGERAERSARNGAKRLSAEAKLQKLKRFSLPQADQGIGLAALQNCVGTKLFHQQIRDIKDLEQEVERLRQPKQVSDPYATLADRARSMASTARTKIELQQLLQQRKKVIQRIGHAIRNHNQLSAEPTLQDEILHATRIANEITRLEQAAVATA